MLKPMSDQYVPASDRYEQMIYRRCGASGIDLPAISLGLWQNFGGDRPLEGQRAILRRAFDLGVCHFDLANNYGPPYGSAEENFGRILATDFRDLRDELIISSKAGWDMWPGPYGDRGSRKYLLASLDQSLARMGLDYVDIFYSHRFVPDTPLEETIGALATAVQQGKALYAGISSYSPQHTREAAAILREQHIPLLIHQPSYSLLNRWIEPELLDVLGEEGAGAIVFSPLAQGLLTDRYLDGVPEDARAAAGGSSLSRRMLSEENLARVRALNEIARGRGQSLAQMAVAWTLRDPRVTSALVGASSVAQLEDTLGALQRLDFSTEELAEIDRYAVEGGDQPVGFVERGLAGLRLCRFRRRRFLLAPAPVGQPVDDPAEPLDRALQRHRHVDRGLHGRQHGDDLARVIDDLERALVHEPRLGQHLHADLVDLAAEVVELLAARVERGADLPPPARRVRRSLRRACRASRPLRGSARPASRSARPC